MHAMRSEILEQPEKVALTIRHNHETLSDTARAIRQRDARNVLFVARGTSDNAAVFGKYLVSLSGGRIGALAAPSLFTLYSSPIDLRGWVVIGLSQSGETDEIVASLDRAKNLGAYTVAVTNTEKSSIVDTAHMTLFTRAGQEKSIPATKTYTTQLAVLLALVLELDGRPDALAILEEDVPRAMAHCLEEVEPSIRAHVERFRYLERCAVLARGLAYGTAFETALKLKEACRLGAEAMSAADFLHGPIAAVNASVLAWLVAPNDATAGVIHEVLDRLEAKGCERVVVSEDAALLRKATLPLEIPPPTPREAFPLLAILPAQLMAYHLACTKGLNPDLPEGLSKVTHT